ncbi:hypothetical protein [Candidatus Binatus sp.]|uniref:hypothetical protein n=1 Tax=Candidatus Binatus sp. TaxID=2811406 RepID=UPI003C78303F
MVFIAEIVPKRAVARIARFAYGENYVCLPMKHRIDMNGAAKTAEYEWQLSGSWSRLYAHASGALIASQPISILRLSLRLLNMLL